MYLIRKDGQSFGPFNKDEIRELYRSGGISPATEVAQEGTDEWKPLIQWNFVKESPPKPESPISTYNTPLSPSNYQPYASEQGLTSSESVQYSDSPPIGVILIAILYGLSSLGCLAVAIGAFIMQRTSEAMLTSHASSSLATIISSLGAVVGIFTLTIAILHAFIVYGLAKLRNWARVTVIVLSVLGLLSQLQSCIIINAHNAASVITKILMIMALLISIIVYLTRPNIRSRFN